MKTLTALLFFFLALLFPIDAYATSITITPIADTYVDNQHVTTSYGGNNGLYSYYQLSSKHSRMYLKFPITQIPPSAIISSAKMKMYLLASTGVSSVNLELFRATGSWSESMTWNDQDDLLSDNDRYAVKAIGNTLGWKEWDIKSLVQDWVSGRRTNYGVMIIFQSGIGDSYSRTFFSRDMSGDFKPKLEVTYTMPTPTPTSTPRNIQVNVSNFYNLSLSDINKWDLTDNSVRITWNSSSKGSSWVYYGDSSDGINRFDRQAGQSDNTNNHSVTLTNLSPGKKYSYKVMTRVSLINYKYSGIDHFTTLEAGAPPVAEPTPEPTQAPGSSTTTSNEANPVEKAKTNLENQIAEYTIENSIGEDNPAKSEPGSNSEPQTTELKSSNPFVLIAGSVGVNRLAGILLIVAGLLTLLLLYLLMHTTKKVHQYIKNNYSGNGPAKRR